MDISEQDINQKEKKIDSSNIGENIAHTPKFTLPEKISLKEAIDEFQNQLIRDRLQSHHQNQAATARELGMNRSNFYRLLKRLNVR